MKMKDYSKYSKAHVGKRELALWETIKSMAYYILIKLLFIYNSPFKFRQPFLTDRIHGPLEVFLHNFDKQVFVHEMISYRF